MDDQELLHMMAAELWDVYRRAGWKGKLDLLRHRFSMHIAYADDVYEDLRIDLDDRAELKYAVNKAAVIGDGHSTKGFARFVFTLREGQTKTFAWVTAHGIKEWILSRDDAALYVDIPGFGGGFFIRYRDFRDECFAAYEKRYGWGYQSEIQRIEVPERDFESLTWLEPEEEFELVRYLDDGRSFETTDVDRLLRFVDERRSQEASFEDPDPDRVRRFLDLYQAIKYYVAQQERLRRKKKLRPATGVDFSWLKDNWEECDFRYNVSTDPNDWHDAVYRRYGDLPDGRHFGVTIWPKSDPWPPMSLMMIVSKNGEMQVNSIMDDRWDADEVDRWPLAAAATPSGKSIVWLKDGRIWVWREDERGNCFWPDGGEELTDRIEGIPVYDALMREDGILVLFQEGKVYAYFCDEDIVLVRCGDCWVPASEVEAPKNHDELSNWNRVEYWPDSFAVMIRAEDDEYDYYSCGVRRVCFEPGLEVIKPGMLADNPDLESVTIPASVKEVQTWAFGCCTNLKKLVIEGDLSRVANWAPDAFDACACEEEYLRLRGADLQTKGEYRMADQVFIVEDGTLTKFEADDHVEIVYIPDCVKRIGCRAFFEASVGKVVIPDGVTTIEPDAFMDCSLQEIEIPDSVTTIETWAFSGCEALREIRIPESVISIGAWAIGYREDQFHPWLDPIPFGRPVIIYGKKGSEAERYTKDNYWCFNEHITEFREIKNEAGSQEGEA